MKEIYTLTTFWLGNTPKENAPMDIFHSNVVQQGFWPSLKECEDWLMDQWFNIEECWNNAAVIECYKIGCTTFQWKPPQWWYFSSDPRNELPELLKETPDKMKFNDKKQTWTLGR